MIVLVVCVQEKALVEAISVIVKSSSINRLQLKYSKFTKAACVCRDVGHYSCLATNSVGEGRAGLELGGEPHLVTITRPPHTTETTARLGWRVASLAGVDNTTIEYSR